MKAKKSPITNQPGDGIGIAALVAFGWQRLSRRRVFRRPAHKGKFTDLLILPVFGQMGTQSMKKTATQIEVGTRTSTMNGAEQTTSLNVNTKERAIDSHDKIVSAHRATSLETFEELHAIYSRRLYRTIIAITKNPDDAEDALQDTFLRVYLARETFEGRSSIYSWLTRIAINSALVILRKRRARAEVLFDPQPDDRGETIPFEVRDSAPNPEEAYDLHHRELKTLRALCCLDPRLRAPIRMQLMHGRSVREISRALNISEAAVKARLYRARQRLCARHNDHARIDQTYCRVDLYP
jgi:RNA polymerase sigma-70 factor (ECF subfamily)